MGLFRRREPAQDTASPPAAASTQAEAIANERILHLETVFSVAAGVMDEHEQAKEEDASNNAIANPGTTRDEWLAATDSFVAIIDGIAMEATTIAQAMRAGRDHRQPGWEPDIPGDEEAVRKVLSLLRHMIDGLTERGVDYWQAAVRMNPAMGNAAEWRGAEMTFLSIAEDRFQGIVAKYYPDPAPG